MRKGFATLLCALGVAGSMAIPASAGADSSASAGMALVFGGGRARNIVDNVAVPVRCLGGAGGFCSGVVTLSRNGRHTTIPFSVRGGGHEFLFVPLRVGNSKDHPRKVRGVASTVQPLGPPTSTAQYFYAR
jgi:hypothetical protein